MVGKAGVDNVAAVVGNLHISGEEEAEQDVLAPTIYTIVGMVVAEGVLQHFQLCGEGALPGRVATRAVDLEHQHVVFGFGVGGLDGKHLGNVAAPSK